jgi:hypothetical protein
MDLPLTGYTVHASQKASDQEARLETHESMSMGLKITCRIQRRAHHCRSMESNQGAYPRGELPSPGRPPILSRTRSPHAVSSTTIHIYRQEGRVWFSVRISNSTSASVSGLVILLERPRCVMTRIGDVAKESTVQKSRYD